MPPVSKTQSGSESQLEEVLTLPEAAAYLRVPEAAIVELLAERAIPAQKIGGGMAVSEARPGRLAASWKGRVSRQFGSWAAVVRCMPSA